MKLGFSPKVQDQTPSIEDLEQRDTKKTEFFLAASHQLKSPLAIVQWCLQSTIESESLDHQDKELVLKALGQANAMSRLITDMLHVFRLVNKKGGQVQTYESVDLNQLVAEAVIQSEIEAHKHDAHVVKGPLEILPPVFADPVYLREAVMNLLDNAIKYSPPGGTINIYCRLASDNFVELSVQDQGIGIPQADQRHLFHEFFRGEEAQSIAHEGTGLGLVLVKHIIEEFGGEIVVKSELHQGSTFIIRLPAH